MAAERRERQTSDSFLVRCWAEPREAADQPDVVRFYVRNLRTGEEHYLKEPAQLGELVERGVRRPAAEVAERPSDRDVEVG